MNQILLTMPKSVETALVSRSSTMRQDKLNAGINDIWKGYVVTSSNQVVQAYVKKTNNINELYREILCSLLGRAIGISTPEPLIVKIEANHPDIPGETDQYFFGTKDCESAPFTRFMANNKCNEKELLSYENLHEIIVFDELIANRDRHPGNVLFDGEKYDFIDHGDTFPISLTFNTPMVEFALGDNLLAAELRKAQGHNHVKTQIFMRKVNKFIKEKLNSEQIKLLPESCKIDQKELSNHNKNIQDFLLQRLPILSQLVGFSVKVTDSTGQLSLLSAGG